ncbi:hypothetical protein C8R41DRAFT_810463 [Lentinula lateritia]|uniref:Extracellular membrane protein CFEM domain-containing protein n=1 Tax=Lentinula lateritia TaxID=40482 RepID=A0ABQ8VXA9_9AGAR|nr:hypothetical protein C8R41DRAFT_810463 [Lentinula lateritia]
MLALSSASYLLMLLASQVTAFTFNVSVPFPPQTLSAAQLLPNFTGAIANCAANCSNVQTELSGCQDDASCLCATQLVSDLRNCEQCMYESLIAANAPLPDPKAGSTPVLVGYQAACAAFNITLNTTQVALALPTDWDGPFGLGLNIVGTVFTVGAGFILGTSSLLLLSNL